jgi:hypothetical protein
MPEEKNIMLDYWHSDAWWMKVYNHALTSEETRKWELHMVHCEKCRQEWEAARRLEYLLKYPPETPSLSPEFSLQTYQRAIKRLRFRRILSLLIGGLIVTAISLGILFAFSSAFVTLEQYAGVIFSARYMLFSSFVQVVLGLIESWRMLLPFCIGLTILIFVLLMPNSAFVTFAVIWYARKQRRGLGTVG